MPSSATITSFYNFSANNKARASQVNNNFDVFRGHIIPVHVSTATSANNTYDLGSYEYRWANLYAYDLELGSTSTNAATINIDTATATAELVFKLNGTEKARINTNGVSARCGLPFAGLSSTSSADGGAVSSGLPSTLLAYTAGSTDITGSTLTITTIGRPVMFTLINIVDNSTSAFSIASSSGTVYFSGYRIDLYRNNSLIKGISFAGRNPFTTSTASQPIYTYQNSGLTFYDFPGAGTYNYHLTRTGVVDGDIQFTNCRSFCYELK